MLWSCVCVELCAHIRLTQATVFPSPSKLQKEFHIKHKFLYQRLESTKFTKLLKVLFFRPLTQTYFVFLFEKKSYQICFSLQWRCQSVHWKLVLEKGTSSRALEKFSSQATDGRKERINLTPSLTSVQQGVLLRNRVA